MPGKLRNAVSLLLNATYEPLCVVSSRRAVVLVLAEKAVAIEYADVAFHSATSVIQVPAVVKLNHYVRVPFPARVPLSRKAIFARDGGRCQYCGTSASSIDHIVPRSRGGEHAWENVVAACRRCNHVKADRSLSELGWRLKSTPRAPIGAHWRVLGYRSPDPRWHSWLNLPDTGFQEQASA